MRTPKRLAILGRQPELGLLELESLLGSENVTPFGKNATLISGEVKFDLLGGVVKLGEVVYEGPVNDVQKLDLEWRNLARAEGKTTFGLSFYGRKESPRLVLATGLEIKKKLKEFGSVRFIEPKKGMDLSAAQIVNYRLLDEGFELLAAINGDKMVVARTTNVQDIDWYSRRDYERPSRSAKVGMLPPKLAQVLVNTTKAPVVVDPFCGTGVVLQESLLGGREAFGSDLSAEMVAASRANLGWLKNERPEIGAWKVMEPTDARDVHLPGSDLAIVSEGYLGANMSAAPSPIQLAEVEDGLRGLYLGALKNIAGQTIPGTEIALCVPSWRLKNGWHDLNLVDDLGKLGYTMKAFRHVPGVVRYARSDQIVGRQLYLLTRT